MTRHIYYVPTLAHESVQPGQPLAFGGAEAFHAATVKRTQPGETVDLVDGFGLRVTLRVTRVEKSSVHGTICNVCEEKPHDIPITLVQALSKNGRDEQAIETATEYGVDTVIPWQAERSIVKWQSSAKKEKALAKWESTVLAAMKQSRRSWKPRVCPMLTSHALISWIREQVEAGTHVYVCHEEATQPLVYFLRKTSDPMAIIVGPEGGITPEEIAAFEQAGASAVLLGEHVMRASSAGPWAIAVIRAYAIP